MSAKIKIIADSKIPFLKGVLDNASNIEYAAPSEITKEKVNDADALIVRTRTKCNADLLEGSKVKFIATATIGYDHIDTKYCDSKNIKWVNAPGCNSSSVKQYIASALLTLAEIKKLDLSKMTIGIIGVGNVGSKIASVSEILGMKVLLNDPPRERTEGKEKFVALDKLISESDIITFHVPLNKAGIDKTFHMADESFFSRMKGEKILFNSSRGEVVETNALKNAIRNKIISASLLDVWENEPEIDKELLNLVDIATPHIAGYSADGKANGTSVCVKEISSFFGLGIDFDWYPEYVPSPESGKYLEFNCAGKSQQEILKEIICATYEILKDDSTLRTSVETFEKQRNSYPVRREFPFFSVKLLNSTSEIDMKVSRLGFNLLG